MDNLQPQYKSLISRILNELEHTAVDANMRSDGDIADLAGVRREAVNRLRNGDPSVGLEVLVQVTNALQKRIKRRNRRRAKIHTEAAT